MDQKTGHIYIKENNLLKDTAGRWTDFRFFMEESWQKISSTGTRGVRALQTVPFKKIALDALALGQTGLYFIIHTTKTFWSRITQPSSEKQIRESSLAVFDATGSKRPWSDFLPHWSRITGIYSRLEFSQKLYATGALVLIFVVPYFLAKIDFKKEEPTPQIETAEKADLPLKNDKNVVRLENLETNEAGRRIEHLINLNDSIYAISEHSITNLEDQTVYPLPTDFSAGQIAFGMDDLNLIFLLDKNDKLLSWSPASKKFERPEMNVPGNSQITEAKAFSTYAYLLDKNNDQIYRYPRGGQGFSEKTNWLKDQLELDEIQALAVSENIYLAEKSNLVKLYRGKKQEFQLEKSETPFIIDKIFTRPEIKTSIFSTKTNARIGTIIA